jgi:hypothetical protein
MATRPTTAPRNANARPADDLVAKLATMTPDQRRAAAAAGRLTHAERTAWAARYPEEVPLVNGELPWIALALADLD